MRGKEVSKSRAAEWGREEASADFPQTREAGQHWESREVLPFAEKMSLGCNEYYNLHLCLVSYPEMGERRHFLKSTLIFSTACRFSSRE